MQVSTARLSWLSDFGQRLDCKPYMGPVLRTRQLLKRLPYPKEPLSALTAGFDGGIFNGPQFTRNYVDSAAHGIRFMTGSSMQLADLSDIPLLSSQDAHSRKLRHLELNAGMTLISCSGTIGKTVYARSEMAGIWASQDILKVQPDETKIHAGYLFAYLSSHFGVPLLVAGTYGGIIQHLEPEHIRSLPVPRLGQKIEKRIHDLIESAARSRDMASLNKAKAKESFLGELGIRKLKPANAYVRPLVGSPSSANAADRMDSTYFVSYYSEARHAFDAVRGCGSEDLGSVAEVFIPTIFKREYAEDPAHGYPYITGADVFNIRQEAEQYLMKTVAHEHRLLLEEGMIVLHEAGQRYGLIGHGVMVGSSLEGYACTNNMVRIKPKDPRDAGYIYATLASEHGVRLLKREAAGSSIPHLDERRVSQVRIPWPHESLRWKIAALAHEARKQWDKAVELENRAYEELAMALDRK